MKDAEFRKLLDGTGVLPAPSSLAWLSDSHVIWLMLIVFHALLLVAFGYMFGLLHAIHFMK